MEVELVVWLALMVEFLRFIEIVSIIVIQYSIVWRSGNKISIIKNPSFIDNI